YYNRQELAQSIEQEVTRILNTRTTAKHSQYVDLSEDQVNFGLPEMFGLMDFSQYDGTNEEHWARIAEFCEEAIRRYEPRINNVLAVVTLFEQNTQSLHVTIQADYGMKEFKGEVTFETILSLGK